MSTAGMDDIQDPSAFASIVRETVELVPFFDDAELARSFGMTRSTAKRWREGTACPHPLMRKTVYARFQEEVETEILLQMSLLWESLNSKNEEIEELYGLDLTPEVEAKISKLEAEAAEILRLRFDATFRPLVRNYEEAVERAHRLLGLK